MRPEAVTNKDPGFLIRMWFSLGIKHTFDPLQADLGVSISRFGERIMPSRGGICGPVASMGCGRPDYHRKKRPTVEGDTFNRSDDCPLNTRASIVSRIVLTYKDFDGAEQVEALN